MATGTGQFAVVMVDVDEFKKYNDLYGHLAGDDCLQRIAQALRSAVWRSGDVVARYGGEEMVLLLPATGADGVLEVAQRARLAVADLQIPHAASALGTVSVKLNDIVIKSCNSHDPEASI